jgi:exodeoxyribonuclease VII small subunit
MAKSPAPQDAAPLPTTYEAALQELEALVARLDAGQLPLDELLSAYQRGAGLLQFCRARLDAVEQQIQVMDNGELKNWTGGS